MNIFEKIRTSFIMTEIHEERLRQFEERIRYLERTIEDFNTYYAIGIPQYTRYDNRLNLLRAAKDKGFFHSNAYFTSVNNPNGTWYNTHFPSPLSSSYIYYPKDDVLYIPAIGVKGNFFSGSIPIYRRGVWSKVFFDNVVNKGINND